MNKELSFSRRKRLAVQGFVNTPEDLLKETAPWLRLAYGLCTSLAITGTILASPTFLWSLSSIAFLGAIFSVHPFDLIYNYGIRYITKTRKLPKRGGPGKFACAIGTVWLIATGWLFYAGLTTVAYALGGMLGVVGTLVSTIDFCIPSMIYRRLFGYPEKVEMAK